MTISIKEDNLTVAVELEENDFDKSVSCEEAMIAALDVLSRIFSQESVTRAYYQIDLDSLIGESHLDNPFVFSLLSINKVQVAQRGANISLHSFIDWSIPRDY